MVEALRTVAAALLGGGLWAAQAVAGVAAQRHGDWEVIGLPAGGCAMVQTVHGRHTGGVLAEALLHVSDWAEGAVMLLRVPTGAWLADGIAYRHPAQGALALDWQSCDARRCSAIAVLDETEAARLRAGASVTIAYRPLRDAPVLNVPLSLRGLTAAWRAAGQCVGGAGAAEARQ